MFRKNDGVVGDGFNLLFVKTEQFNFNTMDSLGSVFFIFKLGSGEKMTDPNIFLSLLMKKSKDPFDPTKTFLK